MTTAAMTVAYFLLACTSEPLEGATLYRKQGTWAETMLACRSTLQQQQGQEKERAAASLWMQIKNDFPVEWDWMLQDGGAEFGPRFLTAENSARAQDLTARVVGGFDQEGTDFRARLEGLSRDRAQEDSPAWLALYAQACQHRRAERLQTVAQVAPRIVFTKHPTLRPSFFAYTEGQSDAQDERHFRPGAELCLFELDGTHGTVRTLLADETGAIRDPAVSWDGKRVMFAWKKSLDDDDYHLYELEVASGRLKQVTSGKGFADYEPAYLPNGDVIFSSTRCVQTVDCWWTEVSNLYTCDSDGRFLRRLSFDQVHAIYPQVTEDGRVIYTRWDYNDRGQIFPQPLFQMNADGTGQTEFYGNSSWFPTTIAHARGIPGTQKVMAILCGHHTSQAGKLAIIDPALGRQENSGVQLAAPMRPAEAERIDAYGQEGELWQYPFPLNARECIVTYAPLGWDKPQKRRGDADFGIYWMDVDGRRELLAWDEKYPCSQAVPLMARQAPQRRSGIINYADKRGTYFVQDVYAGPGLAGVPRGTIKKLRVVALRFRAAGVGHNGSGGPGGGALVSTPVAVGNGTWDVKVILGDAKVHEDGSAMFHVPARTPVYFQALDENGYAVQTMRSWSTLQPGEVFGCAGCHENKNTSPQSAQKKLTLAARAGPQDLEPFYGPPRGFSFIKEVQPILDRHCVRCHRDRSAVQALLRDGSGGPLATTTAPRPTSVFRQGNQIAFSLLRAENIDKTAKRRWSDSYLVLTCARPDRSEDGGGGFAGDCEGRVVRWIGSQSVPEPLAPYFAGAARSSLMGVLKEGHQQVKLSREELDKISAWIDLLVPYCGDYYEANAWSDEEMQKYEGFAEKRRRMELVEEENIKELMARRGVTEPGASEHEATAH